MKRWHANLLWMGSTMVLAGLTSLVVTRMSLKPTPQATRSEEDFHEWVHRNLDLSATQHEELATFEIEFSRKRTELQKRIALTGNALAVAVKQGNPEAPEIASALDELNAAQAELQRITLEHFFTMDEHLTPPQSAKLLQWTHDSLVHQ